MAIKMSSWISLGLTGGGSLVGGLIISFMSKKEWLDFYKRFPLLHPLGINTPLSFILAPLTFLFNLGQACLAGFNLYSNKPQIKNIISFLIESARTLQSAISILAMIIVISKIVAPIFLLVVIGIDTLFQLGSSIYHLWQWELATSKLEKYQNKLTAIRHSMIFIANLLTVIGLGILFFPLIGPSLLLPIGITTAIISAVSGILIAMYNLYSENKINKLASSYDDHTFHYSEFDSNQQFIVSSLYKDNLTVKVNTSPLNSPRLSEKDKKDDIFNAHHSSLINSSIFNKQNADSPHNQNEKLFIFSIGNP